MTIKNLVLILFVLFIMTAMPSFAGAQRINVFVSILPQAYFVERVGGDAVDVEVLVGPGKSPATYEPTSRQMSKLAETDIYFRIGTPFENSFLPKLADLNEKIKIWDMRKGIELRYFGGHHHASDNGDTGKKTSHQDRSIPDPHIWLDPKLVITQAKTIYEALSAAAPEKKGFFKSNLDAFIRDLESLDQKLTEILAPIKGRKFYVFHPAFGYFGDSYGLIQEAVEIEGKSPSAKQLAALIDSAKKEGVRVIFVQPQYAKKGAQTIAKAIDGVVVPINPLPRDYLAEMEKTATTLKELLHD